MLRFLIYSMIYLGSALMVYNIYCYIRYAQDIRQRGNLSEERRILSVPTALLVMFLFGYLAVGILGKPDLIISGILFGGSIFVAIMVYLLRRITNRILENEHLKAQLMASEATSKAKTSFLSNMSHEMRTPLNAIVGLVRLTKSYGVPQEAKDSLDKIDASARHLLSIVNDVLDMSSIESGTLELKEQVFSFGDIMLQFNSIVGNQCHEKGLAYNCERVGNVDEEFVGDAMKLKQVMLNIADNAVKYTNAPGWVHCRAEQISTGEDTCTLRFTVQDNGIGMDREFLSTVFDAFAREDFSSTSLQGGSGLGLSITKSIVEMMGGNISIESEKGVGTTVTITVVLGRVKKAESAPVPEDAEDVRLEGRRLLVVEDIDLNAEILMDLLEMEDISSERAENGQIAVDKFSASPIGYYDGILMDLRMPVMDGLEATRRIRALDRPDAGTVPILALTANCFEEDVQNSLAAGMNAHLAKPADIAYLCSELRRYLNSHEK